jgi:hypothetical protein
VDFRNGIDGLAAMCRQVLGENPLEGAVYVFRNRTGTALKLLLEGVSDLLIWYPLLEYESDQLWMGIP